MIFIFYNLKSRFTGMTILVARYFLYGHPHEGRGSGKTSFCFTPLLTMESGSILKYYSRICQTLWVLRQSRCLPMINYHQNCYLRIKNKGLLVMCDVPSFVSPLSFQTTESVGFFISHVFPCPVYFQF